MSDKKTYKELQGKEITQELQEVTEEDLKAIPDMTKDSLGEFGRTHLGVEVVLNRNSHKNISKDILALAQKKYDESFVGLKDQEEIEGEQLSKNMIVTESDEEIPKSFLKDEDPDKEARTKSDAPLDFEEIAELRRLAERHGYSLTPIHKDIREIPTNHTVAGKFTHLKNTNTGNVKKRTPALEKLTHMAPCDKNGNRVF